MSSPASGVTTLVNDLITGIVTLFDSFAQALSTYAPVIATIVITMAMVYGLANTLSRIPIIRRFLSWIGL